MAVECDHVIYVAQHAVAVGGVGAHVDSWAFVFQEGGFCLLGAVVLVGDGVQVVWVDHHLALLSFFDDGVADE